MIELETDQHETWLVVRLSGEGLLTSGKVLEAELQRVVETEAEQIVIDMTGVTYASSVFMATLIQFRGKIKQRGGMVCMFGLQSPVAKAFEVARLDWIIPAFETLEEATAES